MTRDEHVAWCKQRALEYVDRGELSDAVVSMLSDLGKHSATAGHLGMLLAPTLIGQRLTRDQVRKWIEGFR